MKRVKYMTTQNICIPAFSVLECFDGEYFDVVVATGKDSTGYFKISLGGIEDSHKGLFIKI